MVKNMGKIFKINRKKLSEAVTKAVIQLAESNHFSAMRNIEHMAASTSMEFEKNIVDALGLLNPDSMDPQIQTKYFQIVTKMKDGIRTAVMDAAKELLSFPRQQDGKK